MNTRPTVVILNDFAHERGGADQVAIQSALALARAGHAVHFFSAVGPVDPRLSAEPGLQLHCLGLSDLLGSRSRLKAGIDGLWNRAVARQLRALLATLDPRATVVHAHCYTKALTAAALDASLKAGFRTALTLHDYFITCPNGALYLYPSSQPCPHKPLGLGCLLCRCDARSQVHKLWRVARGLLQNRIARLPARLDCLVALGRHNHDTACRSLPASKLRIVHNPVDIEQRPPVQVESAAPVLFVGRIEDYKGVFLLAEAARQAGSALLFCGDGSALPKLKALYPEFEYAGRVDRAGLETAMQRSRALAFPSLWSETFGLTALEAMARGLAPLVSTGTAPQEWVRDGENGLCFERASVDSLVTALRKSAEPGLAARLGGQAYADYWRAPLSPAVHAEALGRLYAELLA